MNEIAHTKYSLQAAELERKCRHGEIANTKQVTRQIENLWFLHHRETKAA